MIVFIGLLVLLVLVGIVFGYAVYLGSNAYAGWRHMKREDLKADAYVRPFYPGIYQSPFIWHRSDRYVPKKKEGKIA